MQLEAPTIIALDPEPEISELSSEHDLASVSFGEPKIRIRLANSEGRREAANLLVQTMYAWRGYKTTQRESVTKKPESITLVAQIEGEIVGTMSLFLDGDGGLPGDENFRDHLDELRKQGIKLCEASQLAINTRGKLHVRMFAAMLHICYIYSYQIHGYGDYIIEVNPRHANIYCRMLGFRVISDVRVCERVDAPALLLRLEQSYLADQILQHAGRPDRSGKNSTFYPHFFPPEDVDGIAARLKSMQSF